MGKPKRHFMTICRTAEIENLHIHDFKHMAMSNMIENDGYSIEQIVQLGIQFDEKLIKKVYWHKNAEKVLISVGHSVGHSNGKTVEAL
jgi:hypothetical protein